MRTTTSELALAALLSLGACNTGGADVARSDRECAACHAAQSTAHATSAHARAPEGELFVALTARLDVNSRAFCDRCHAPHDVAGERGVGCVTCHTAIATRGVSNGRLVMGDGDEMLGGFDAVATSAHASARSAFTRSADLCGACHEVAGPGALVETPYAEWSSSPARMAGVTCVDCHMATSPGIPGASPRTGAAATDGPPRPLTDHAFVGPEHPRAGELLQRAAAMELAVSSRAGEALDVAVTVINRNPGHALPSGARFAREVWVELVAVDARGDRHVVTGGLDAQGAPSADDAGRIELGDRVNPHGSLADITRAAPSEVRAIAAGGRRTWHITVAAAWGGAATAGVTARLRYRRDAWALRAAAGLAPDVVAPVDLASASVAVGP